MRADRPPAIPVVIVGGGIAGLSAAWELHRRGIDFLLLEASTRLGGVILTERADDLLIDAGPDSLLVQKPAGLELCRELGLADRLIATRPPRTAFVLRAGRLFPLPEPSVLGIPLGARSLARSSLLTTRGKARMALDLLLPASTEEDESIGHLVRRRLGEEAVAYLAEPLLAGIHAGDVDRLSAPALFPLLVDAERRHGSLMRGLGRLRGPAPDEGVFRSFPDGMGELVAALGRALPAGAVRTSATVTALSRDTDFVVALGSGQTLRAAHLLLALPAHLVARLVTDLDPPLAGLCGEMRATSTASVFLAYDRSAVLHPLAGSGFVVPSVERPLRLLAVTWISSKWPHRAAAQHVLLRAFVGGARHPDLLDRSDGELCELAHQDLSPLLGLSAPPRVTRVYRWDRATPQHEVGHLNRLAAIQRRLDRLPSLHLAGGAFRGTGIPDCIADARAVAAAIAGSGFPPRPVFG